MTFNEAMEAARKWNLALDETGQRAGRDLELLKLSQEERFPAVLAVLLEFEEDLTRAVANYDRTAEERNLDAGGLATVLRIRDTLEDVMTPKPQEPEEKK